MTRRLFSAAVLALVASAVPAARGGEIPRDPAFVEQVNESIDRGVRWLLGRQERDGGFGERPDYPAAQTAIVYHTLRVCDVPRSDERMERAYAALRREYLAARSRGEIRTYTAALVMMAIESHGWPERRRSSSDSRYANQEERTVRLDEEDRNWMQELVEFMEGNQNPVGAWRYGLPVGRYAKVSLPANDYDHSNTQYALLGLKSASRSGVDVGTEVYLKALEHLLDAQQRDGPEVPRVDFVGKGETFAKEKDRARGWSYFSLEGQPTRDDAPRGTNLQGAYGSMTAGCLGAVVICRSELLGRRGYSQREDARAEQAVWDGIAWLGRNFAVDRNPEMGGWHYYWLYALERAGVLAGVDWMGEHDWYGEGARFLVAEQERSGAWVDTGSREVTTCFALLFLKRGTTPVPRGAVTPSGGADAIDFSRAASLSGKDLDDLVDLVVARWRRAPGGTQRAELSRGLASAGAKVVLPLLTVMATGGDDARPAAHELLVAITGQTFHYDPAASVEARYDQLMAWEEWYMAHAERLHFEAASGRLR